MNIGNNSKKILNISLIALLIIITIFTAFHEGYLKIISVPFWLVLIAGFSISFWLALSISTKHLLSLILVIFIIEYVKEAIGIRSRLWTYHGVGEQFNFGVWAWVLGGLATYTLATRVVIRPVRKLKLVLPKWVNTVILLVLVSLIPLTLRRYWSGIGSLFLVFYALLLIAGIYASLKIDFPVFAGIVITAWLVSNPSEYLGSVNSGIWTFTHNPDYPPFFLLFGCWPLEILVQYSLSVFLVNESLGN